MRKLFWSPSPRKQVERDYRPAVTRDAARSHDTVKESVIRLNIAGRADVWRMLLCDDGALMTESGGGSGRPGSCKSAPLLWFRRAIIQMG